MLGEMLVGFAEDVHLESRMGLNREGLGQSVGKLCRGWAILNIDEFAGDPLSDLMSLNPYVACLRP